MRAKNSADAIQEAQSYACSLCGVSYSSEVLVRAHIAFSDDEIHKNKNGFMPEDTVVALDEDGDKIKEIKGKGKQAQSINSDELPDGLSQRDRVIVRTAARLTNVDNNKELVRRINGALRSEGFDEMSYTGLIGKVRDFFNVEKKETEDITFDDLTDKQKRVLNVYKNNRTENGVSLSIEELALKADVDKSYPSKVIEKYGHLVESNNSDASEDTSLDKKSEDTNENIETEDDTGEIDLLSEANKSKVLSESGLTDMKKRAIEFMSRNPGADNKTIAEAADCSVSYPSRIRDDHSDLIMKRSEELSNIDQNQQPLDSNTDGLSWENKTERQKSVLRLLSREDDPKNPDDIAKIIHNSKANHEDYVLDIIDKFGYLAVKYKYIRDELGIKGEQNIAEKLDEIDIKDIKITSNEEPIELLLEESDISEDKIDEIKACGIETIPQLEEKFTGNEKELFYCLDNYAAGVISNYLNVMPREEMMEIIKEDKSIEDDSSETEIEKSGRDDEKEIIESLDETIIISSSDELSEELDNILSYIRDQKKLAEREFDLVETEVSAGKIAMADQIEDKIESIKS